MWTTLHPIWVPKLKNLYKFPCQKSSLTHIFLPVMANSYFAAAEFLPDGEKQEVLVEGMHITIGHDEYSINSIQEYPTCYELTHTKTGEKSTVVATKTISGIDISLNGYTYSITVHSAQQHEYGSIINSSADISSLIVKVQSPMPGLLKAIQVEVGQSVRKGEALFILEAMKMENAIKSPIQGIIKDLHAISGLAIEKGYVLCTIGPQ